MPWCTPSQVRFDRPIAPHACVVVVSALLLGCAPVKYSQDIRHAERAVEVADKAHALKYAPYEFTLAREYLHAAKQRASRADYQIASRYAKKSKSFAEDARKRAANPMPDTKSLKKGRHNANGTTGPDDAGSPEPSWDPEDPSDHLTTDGDDAP